MSKTKIEFSEEFMKKFGKTVHSALNDRWTWKIIYWAIDWTNGRKLTNIMKWVNEQIANPASELEILVQNHGWAEMPQSQAIIEILRFVNANVKYISDFEKTGIAEVWQEAIRTLKELTGDCEDGAVLILVLARLSGIPATRIRLTASYVFNPSTSKLDGHAYVKYKPEFMATLDDDTWMVLDWCWFYDRSWINVRPFFKDLNNYREAWFEVNDTKYYGKYKIK